MMWAAKCKSCGKLSGVRPSKSVGKQLDLANPSEKIKAKCPHRGYVNDFLGSDLVEVPGVGLPFDPPSAGE
jgi:hypothetical protein